MNCTHIISGDLWGGKEAQMLLQLKQLSKDNEVSVLLFNSLETHKKYKEAGINCIVVEEKFGFIKLILDLRQHVNYQTVVVAHGYKELLVALYLKYKNRSKVVVTFHGMAEPHRSLIKNLKSKITFTLHTALAKIFADKIICVSNALKENLGLENAVVIRNCVEIPMTSLRIDRNNSTKIIFMAGRLVPVKRYDLAIKALNDINQNVELHIAGDGVLRAELEITASKKVKFLGFRNDIPELLKQADIFLICSDSEGIPTILLEALATGAKCIATAVGGIPEVVKFFPSGCCKLIEPGNSLAISNAISDLLISDYKIDLEIIRGIIKEKFSPQRAATDLGQVLNLL